MWVGLDEGGTFWSQLEWSDGEWQWAHWMLCRRAGNAVEPKPDGGQRSILEGGWRQTMDGLSRASECAILHQLVESRWGLWNSGYCGIRSTHTSQPRSRKDGKRDQNTGKCESAPIPFPPTLFFFLRFFYLFMRDTEKGRDDTGFPKGLWDHDLSQRQTLNHSATQVPLLFCF